VVRAPHSGPTQAYDGRTGRHPHAVYGHRPWSAPRTRARRKHMTPYGTASPCGLWAEAVVRAARQELPTEVSAQAHDALKDEGGVHGGDASVAVDVGSA